ncbi:MAG: hypothetical protein RL657_441, partial [Pseudomonadota bacterium]
MNDIRRTILWVIFGFSMVLLWDQWQIHNGNKPTFFPQAPVKTETASAATAAQTPEAGVPAPAATASQAAAGSVPTASNSQPRPRERYDVRTDVLHLVIDSEGASIVRADLLKYKTPDHAEQAMRLLDESKERVY